MFIEVEVYRGIDMKLNARKKLENVKYNKRYFIKFGLDQLNSWILCIRYIKNRYEEH